jgi:hypothetical protein
MSSGFKYTEQRFLSICEVVDVLNERLTIFMQDYNNIVVALNQMVTSWIAEDEANLTQEPLYDDRMLSLYDEGSRD